MTRKLLVVEVPGLGDEIYLKEDSGWTVRELPSAEELGRVALRSRPMLGTYENDCQVVGQAILDALTKGKHA